MRFTYSFTTRPLIHKHHKQQKSQVILKIMGNCIAGHSSINMLKRLMVNIEAFSTIRAAYSSPSAFDVHPMSRHKEQDPIHDQL